MQMQMYVMTMITMSKDDEELIEQNDNEQNVLSQGPVL